MQSLISAINGKWPGSALDTAVGGRIHLDQAPQGCEFPYVVWFVVNDTPEYPGGKTMEGVLIQFSIFSANSSAVEITGILANLRTLFDDCSLTITGSTLVYFIRRNLTTMVENIETATGEQSVKHYSQEYEISTTN